MGMATSQYPISRQLREFIITIMFVELMFSMN